MMIFVFEYMHFKKVLHFFLRNSKKYLNKKETFYIILSLSIESFSLYVYKLCSQTTFSRMPEKIKWVIRLTSFYEICLPQNCKCFFIVTIFPNG